MTQHADLLLKLAQVFAVLAVAGIVLLVGRFRLLSPTGAAGPQFLIVVALAALVACVLPLVLDAAGLPIEAVTRHSAAFLASGAVALGAWAWHGSRAARAAQPDRAVIMTVVTTIAFAVTAGLVIALFAVGGGFLVDLAPAIYLSALFFAAALCASCFLALLFSLGADRRD